MKNILLYILIIFALIGISVPRVSAQIARPITLSAHSYYLEVRRSAVITVETDGGVNAPSRVYFKTVSSPTGASFDPPFCFTNATSTSTYGTCSVGFSGTEPGTYTIDVDVVSPSNGNTYHASKTIQIVLRPAGISASPQLVGSIIDSTPPVTMGESGVKLKIQAYPTPPSPVTISYATGPTNSTIAIPISGSCTTGTDGVCSKIIDLPTPVQANAYVYDVNFHTDNWQSGRVAGKTRVEVAKSLSSETGGTGSTPPPPSPTPPPQTGADGTCSVTIQPPLANNQANCVTAGGTWTPNGGFIIVTGGGTCDIGFINSQQMCVQQGGTWCKSPQIPENKKCIDPPEVKNVYTFLSPLSDQTTFDPGQPNALSTYLNMMIKIVIGLAAVLAVIMIVMGGIQYMTSELISSKEEGKKRIWNAIIGLLVALGCYVLLYMVNPDLLKIEPGLEATTLTYITPEELGVDAPALSSPTPQNIQGHFRTVMDRVKAYSGIYCPGSGGSNSINQIARSFLGKVTYNNTGQNIMGTSGPGGTMYLDCSNYANVVLSCAGISPKSGITTYDMIRMPGNRITGTVESRNENGQIHSYVDGVKLKPGDFIGVNAGGYHHVWVYIGNGEILDSQTNGRRTGQSVISIEKLRGKDPYKGVSFNFVVRN